MTLLMVIVNVVLIEYCKSSDLSYLFNIDLRLVLSNIK